ncbi:MAG TPA: hypothetical protein VE959_22130 [Bryobacteraceae bacterium]|nr:hypothetical protein [Bryobacteraceae bacterium]
MNLCRVARRVRLNKEYFILEKDGIAIIGIMGVDELEDYLEVRDPKVREHIRKSHEDFLAGRRRPAGDLLKELKEPPVKRRLGMEPFLSRDPSEAVKKSMKSADKPRLTPTPLPCYLCLLSVFIRVHRRPNFLSASQRSGRNTL